MPSRIPRRRVALVAGASVACGALMLSACSSPSNSGGNGAAGSSSSTAAAAFKPKVETIIVTSAAGGGIDTAARRLQPYLQKTLGTSVSVVDRPGGQSAVGATALYAHGSDCSYMMITGIPQILYTFKTEKLSIAYKDFYPVVPLAQEPTAIAVGSNSKYGTLKALVAGAKANPGKVRVSVSQFASPDYVSLYQMEQATGSKFNAVQFNGGGPARNALLGGQVDATVAPVFALQALGGKVKILGLFQKNSNFSGVPTVNSALSISVPDSAAYYGLWATAKCHTQNSSDYKALAKAVTQAANSSGYKASLKKAGSLGSWYVTSAGSFQKDVASAQSNIANVLSKDPNLFSGK